MATDTAPLRTRHYWQLPTFAAGVAAAIFAWTAFPPTPRSPAERFESDQASLREALDRRPIDVAAVERLAPAVAAGTEQFPDRANAHYLAGSGFLALAEASPGEAQWWAEAARQFAKADPTKLASPTDQQRVAFRRAKARAAIGDGDPKELISHLVRPPLGEEVDGERRRLLAETYLRATPPEPKKARDEYKHYLGGQTRMAAPALARCKLRLAEIYLSLEDPDPARVALKEIGATAPADVQALSKLYQARLAAGDNNWTEAIKLYEAALAGQGLPNDLRGPAQYQTGLAFLQLKNSKGAGPYFALAAKDSGPVGAAAAARLAVLTVTDPALKGSVARAVDLLDAVVLGTPAGSEFKNPFLVVSEAQAAFEQVIQVALNNADYPSAIRASEVYAVVAANGRDRERRAEARSAWGTSVQKTDPAAALDLFRRAAEDYEALAATHPTAAGKSDFLRKASGMYRQSGDEKAAIAAIERLTQTAGLADGAAAAAWVDKGELLLASGQFAEGVEALKKAMAAPGPAATPARVKLAMAYLDQGRVKARTPGPTQTEAAGLIELSQNLLTQVANTTADLPVEREAQQTALYELGKLLLQQQNFPDAETRFRQLVQTYPTGTLAGSGRLYLGSCLLLIARGDHQGGRPPADADRKLVEAHKVFEELAKSTDPFLVAQADVRLANATLLMKKYDDMPELCQRLAAKYPGKVEGLLIQSMLYWSYLAADRPEPAARTRIEMETAFAKMSATDFSNGAEEYTRDYWAKWFEGTKPRP